MLSGGNESSDGAFGDMTRSADDEKHAEANGGSALTSKVSLAMTLQLFRSRRALLWVVTFVDRDLFFGGCQIT